MDPAKAANALCLLAVVYVIIAVVVGHRMYTSSVPAGDIGHGAWATLNSIAGTGKVRGLQGKGSLDAVKQLKSAVDKIAEEYPDRIEVNHQEILLTPENIFGPFAVRECQAINTESCTNLTALADWTPGSSLPTYKSSTCALSCPFNRSAPDGPYCCGDPNHKSKKPILPAFPSLVSRRNPKITNVPAEGTTFTNIVFRVKGSGNFADNQSILVAGHWDSEVTPDVELDPALPSSYGPGVSDDLAGPAVQLEIARTLARSNPLERDVIFLFDAGEEVADMGTISFRQFHEWRQKPAVAINVEGKGKSDSKIWLVRTNSAYAARAYTNNVKVPVGYSFSEWIFANVNVGYTDMNVFNRARYHAMDLVYIHDSYVYHTPDDSVKYTSPEGLQHQGNSILEMISGMANDPDFPLPLSTEDHVLAGAWNNEFLYDPGVSSGLFYCNLFNMYMWTLPAASAKMLFGCIAILAPIVASALLLGRSESFTSDIVCSALKYASIFLGYIPLGIVSSILCFFMAVSSRDLRTWYDFPYLRLAFLALSAALPVLILEFLRRGPASSCCCRDTTPNGTATSLGVLCAYSLLLLVVAFLLVDIGFTFFWYPFSCMVACLVEALLHKLLPQTKPELYIPLQSSETRHEETLASVMSLCTRDCITVLLPALLTVPCWFDLVMVLSYILDSLKASIGIAALCGLLSITFLLPVLPVIHRISDTSMKVVVALSAALWALFFVACLVSPTDGSKYCYFILTCASAEHGSLREAFGPTLGAVDLADMEDRLGPWKRLYNVF